VTGWRLLLTRPADESAALSVVLAEAGVFSSSLPLLEIEPIPASDTMHEVIQQLDRYCAVIVVSKPAARIAVDLVKQYWPQPPRLKWFSVGAATAQILDDHGLDVSFPEEGDDSEALLELAQLREAVARRDPRVLIMRGEGGRELLAERLRELGASVEYLELYRRELPHYPPATLPERIGAERLPLFVPSPRVAELARAAGAQTVVDCRGASAAALLTALREHPEPVL
jgi:uroporphyrinogen-III synthase